MTATANVVPKSPAPEDLKSWVTDNAFDFLSKGIQEFKTNSKYSLVHFYTGVELLFKARLMAEHWSLVVTDIKNAKWQEFVEGKCITVSLPECICRLENIANEKIEDKKQLDKIRKHRNRIMHFYHDLTGENNSLMIAQIAKEQAVSWYLIKKLLSQSWVKYFNNLQNEISKLDSLMNEHKEYLQVVYDSIKTSINQEIDTGNRYDKCAVCGFLSVKIERLLEQPAIFDGTCRVCNYRTGLFGEIDCPEVDCDGPLVFGNCDYSCSSCEKEFDETMVVDLLDTITDGLRQKELLNVEWRFNCNWCDGNHTVACHNGTYICVQCLEYADEIGGCEWCEEGCLGISDNSFSIGCPNCCGHAGYHGGGRDD